MVDLKQIGFIGLLLLVATLVLSYTTLVQQEMQDEEVFFTNYGNGYDDWLPANGTVFVLSHTNITSSTFVMYNYSDGTIVSSGNYTLDNVVGSVFLNAGSVYNGTNVNMSYSYDVKNYTSAYSIFGNGTSAASSVGGQMPNVGLILGVGLIIGMVYFAFKGWASPR